MRTETMLLLRSLCSVALLVVLGGGSDSAAQGIPGKPIRFIVTSPPGGPTDLIARRFGDQLSARTGQPVVIENRAGGRTIGPGEVARAEPDGHTLLFTVDTYLTVNPALYSPLPYDPEKDFAPVAIVAALNNFTLAVHPSFSARTVRQYVDLAKSKPREI